MKIPLYAFSIIPLLDFIALVTFSLIHRFTRVGRLESGSVYLLYLTGWFQRLEKHITGPMVVDGTLHILFTTRFYDRVTATIFTPCYSLYSICRIYKTTVLIIGSNLTLDARTVSISSLIVRDMWQR